MCTRPQLGIALTQLSPCQCAEIVLPNKAGLQEHVSPSRPPWVRLKSTTEEPDETLNENMFETGKPNTSVLNCVLRGTLASSREDVHTSKMNDRILSVTSRWQSSGCNSGPARTAMTHSWCNEAPTDSLRPRQQQSSKDTTRHLSGNMFLAGYNMGSSRTAMTPSSYNDVASHW